MASNPELQLALMKLLATKHFPLQQPRNSVKLAKLCMALGKILKEQVEAGVAFENLIELKGKGLVNTQPKIILKEEIETCEFEIWLKSNVARPFAAEPWTSMGRKRSGEWSSCATERTPVTSYGE